MTLDQTANFVRGGVASSVASGDTTIDVVDASIYPDPANGNYNIVIWDTGEYTRPDDDPDAEVMRVTGRDTTNDNLTVNRGQENTTAVSHPSSSEMHLSATAKMFEDIDSNKVELSGDTMTGSLDIDTSFPQETVTDTVNSSKSGFQLEDPTAANYGGRLYFDDTASETRLYGLNNGTEQGGLAVARDSDTVSITGDFVADDGELIWDESATYIPTARLQNDAITVAGNSVSLGGSTAINHTNLSNINSDDHHTKYSNSDAISAVEGASFTSLDTADIVEGGTTHLSLDGTGNVEIPNGDLSIAEGQSIDDGTGNVRLNIQSGFTELRDGAGNSGLFSNSGSGHGINAYSGEPAKIYDKPNTQTAVEYSTGTPGTLSLPNAELDLNGNTVHSDGQTDFKFTDDTEDTIKWRRDIYGTPAHALSVRNVTDNTNIFDVHDTGRLSLFADSGDRIFRVKSDGTTEIHSGNLSIAEGQSIEDDGGNPRIDIGQDSTQILGEFGSSSTRFEVKDGIIRSVFDSSERHRFIDVDNSNIIIDVIGGNPGTLSLPNANLDINGNKIQNIREAHFNSHGNAAVFNLRNTDEDSNNPRVKFGTSSGQFRLVPRTDGNIRWASRLHYDWNGDYWNVQSDLRLTTGQSIEDGSGTSRVDLSSNLTDINDQNGQVAFRARDGENQRIYARSDTPIQFYDIPNSQQSVEYITGNPGTLSLPNAELQAGQDVFVEDNNGLVVGDTSHEDALYPSSPSGGFQVKGGGRDAWISSVRYGADTRLVMASSGSSTLGSVGTAVSNNDTIFRLDIKADDGTDLDNHAATMRAEVDNTVATDQVPGRFIVSTTDSTGSLTEALRIDSSQDVEIPNGNIVDDNGTVLDVSARALLSNGQTPSVYDTANSQQIIQFKEGGNVEIPNGKLTVEKNPEAIKARAPTDNNLRITLDAGSTSDPFIDYRQNGTRRFTTRYSNSNDAFGIYSESLGNDVIQALSGGNVEIPNGDLTVSGENFNIGKRIFFNEPTGYLYTDSSSTSEIVIADGDTADNIAQFKEGGDVEIPNGKLFLDAIEANTDNVNVVTHGSGSGRFEVYDGPGAQAVFRANEGGKVEIPNGNLRLMHDLYMDDGTGDVDSVITRNDTQTVFKTTGSSTNDLVLQGRDVDNELRIKDNSDLIYTDWGGDENFRILNGGVVEIPNGNLNIDGDGLKTQYGENQDFSIFYEASSDELVIRDEVNGVDLIRQPKQGATQFIQGADIGSIEAPEDSFTQLANAAATSSAASGDTVGYTFAVDNQTGFSVEGTADGTGGLSSGPVVSLNVDINANDNTVEDVHRIGNSSTGNYFDFGQNGSWIEVQDEGGAREEIVTEDTYIDTASDSNGNNWVSDHYNDSAGHHTRYSDEEAQDAVGTIMSGGTDLSVTYDDAGNAITVDHNDTSTQGDVATTGGTIIDDIDLDGRGHVTNFGTRTLNHNDLSSISSDDHHSKYTDSEARSAVSGSTLSSGLTLGGALDLSENTISGVEKTTFSNSSNDFWQINDGSGGSNTSPHTARFDDRDLRYYAGGTAGAGTVWQLNQDGSVEYPVGPVTINSETVATQTWVGNNYNNYSDENAQDAVGTIMSGGTDLSVTYDDAGNAITVDHNDTSTQGNVSTGGATVIDDINLDGRGHVTNLNTQNRAIDDWQNASDATNNTVDADTVDGFEATDLSRPKNVAVLTSTNTTLDINQTTWQQIPWDSQLQIDAGYTHDPSGSPEQITFDNGGTYRVKAMLTYDSNGNARINPGVKLSINGTRRNALGLSGYARNASGHNEASNYVEETITVNAGDTLRVETFEFGEAGTVTLRSSESELIIEQVSETVAQSSDADTVDGKHAADFVLSAGDTMSGALTLGGDLTATNGETVWDESATEIPDSAMGSIANSTLTNSSITVTGGTDISGGSASLGGSLTVDHADTSTQSNVSASSGNAITDINLDGRGHVTSIGTSSVGGNTFDTINFTDSDSDGNTWNLTEDSTNGHLNINSSGGGGTQVDIEHNGNVRIGGEITENASL